MGANAFKTVGAGGGWIQGAGHGPNANTYGLGVDNVLEHEVVLTNGAIVKANAYSYPDLFWALRGGGGGTFGIVTKVTIKTYPRPVFNGVYLNIVKNQTITNSMDIWLDGMTYLMSKMGDFVDFGLPGYPNMTDSSVSGLFTAPGKSADQIAIFLNPILQNLTKLYYTSNAVANISGDFYHIAPESLEQEIGLPTTSGSRLLTYQGTTDTKTIRNILKSSFANPTLYVLPYLVLGGQVARNSVFDVGLNPAWRTAIVHFIVQGSSEKSDTNSIIAFWKNVVGPLTELMDPISVNSSCYLNEVSNLLIILPCPVREKQVLLGG
jgi:FAD binding domain